MLSANKVSEVINLEILIESAEVRLITSADNSYNWQMLSEKEHLFKKYLSKHSIEVYRELCREVDILFDAVLASKSSNAEEIKTLTKRQEVKVGVTSLTQL